MVLSLDVGLQVGLWLGLGLACKGRMLRMADHERPLHLPDNNSNNSSCVGGLLRSARLPWPPCKQAAPWVRPRRRRWHLAVAVAVVEAEAEAACCRHHHSRAPAAVAPRLRVCLLVRV